jgi:hypothetical protein
MPLRVHTNEPDGKAPVSRREIARAITAHNAAIRIDIERVERRAPGGGPSILRRIPCKHPHCRSGIVL